ncbi:SGNH/GDSL hydrolase family protein [Xanthobacter autotrophicus]|uniref:SGNH/GDSL hydrolase family protein n=1 Tax=Xanthobacter TaxID=279 RepID=UPI0024AAE161|nr:SGNH/GDSL hydrolase family protein [Xanthobacter autotrophicus]MDI4663194.1 SGNH/GDSL hydrolase family protein [Xanthobacter autotrophicus]
MNPPSVHTALSPAATAAGRARARARRLLVPVLALGAIIAVGTVLWHRVPMRTRIAWEGYRSALFSAGPVLAIGDSITYQAAPASLCGEKVTNAAVPGDRIGDLLARAPVLLRLMEPKRVVVAIGINDTGPGHMDIAEWRARYRTLLGLFPKSSLVLVEVNPVDPGHPGYVPLHDRDFIARQNATIRTLAQETGASVVPAPAAVATVDGLHLTREGVAQWRQRLAAAGCAG